jgi:hypothetical protein
MNTVDAVAQTHELALEYSRPKTAICAKIVECLDAFADARRGRYANFVALGDPNLGQDEPIGRWWNEVAELILKEHYYGKDAQARVEAQAKSAVAPLSPATVLHVNEIGDRMEDLLSSSIRAGQNHFVQPYGRYYSLVVARWLADVFSRLSQVACYTTNVHAFFGVWAYFDTYRVDDNFLMTRKIWPLN